MMNHDITPDLEHQHGYGDHVEIKRRSAGTISIVSNNDKVEDNDPSLYTFDTVYNDNMRAIKAIMLEIRDQGLAMKHSPVDGE